MGGGVVVFAYIFKLSLDSPTHTELFAPESWCFASYGACSNLEHGFSAPGAVTRSVHDKESQEWQASNIVPRLAIG